MYGDILGLRKCYQCGGETLVPAVKHPLRDSIEHVYKMFKDAIDAKTRVPLFTKAFSAKADAVLELGRQGYLSDVVDIPMYERAGVDKYGLQTWKCIRGTNKVEGGPHGDIYRKFGALHGDYFQAFITIQNSLLPCSWITPHHKLLN